MATEHDIHPAPPRVDPQKTVDGPLCVVIFPNICLMLKRVLGSKYPVLLHSFKLVLIIKKLESDIRG